MDMKTKKSEAKKSEVYCKWAGLQAFVFKSLTGGFSDDTGMDQVIVVFYGSSLFPERIL